ncbi:GroES-like protein [Penicillium angulare]|uniref:GroES-like protein n=1 Tax=Penicillium angulare TaxID=116970 RepID=UPI00253FC1F1|nr:GroES-like protein [Penicillium angulare]KAJ5278727.1 GroES-like protein [Penicillium angulare]
MPSPSNRAAWQQQCHTPLQIKQTPYPEASTLLPTHLVIKVHAWAINPADIILQDTEMAFVKYPVILGEDIAGTIVEEGSSVTRFTIGDRVIAFALGASGGPAMGGFQEYVVVDESLVARIPGWMAFEEGVVLPLGLTTAAHALSQKEYLGLPVPGSGTAKSQAELQTGAEAGVKGKGKKSVLIWGASSSVGSNAVQLAVASGVEVLATASKSNFETVKKLGASLVFDYNDTDIVEQVVKELDIRSDGCVGIFQAAGYAAALEPVLDIAKKIASDVFVATTVHLAEGVVPEGVRAKMVFGSGHDNVLGVWSEFLPDALEEKRYLAAPEAFVLETRGLEGIQEGYDVLKKGVSARKIVVLAE